MKAREAIARRCVRGSVGASLNMRRERLRFGSASQRSGFGAGYRGCSGRGQAGGCWSGACRGVVGAQRVFLKRSSRKRDESERQALHAAVLTSLDEALDGVVSARRAEGQRLGVALGEIIGGIDGHVSQVREENARRDGFAEGAFGRPSARNLWKVALRLIPNVFIRKQSLLPRVVTSRRK